MKIWSSKKADTLFSRYIRNRADWKCQWCHKDFREKPGQLHNSHFWGRGHSSVRYEPQNCIAACYACHYFKLEKEKQGAYRDFMMKWLGTKAYNALQRKAMSTMKRSDAIIACMSLLNKV